MLGVFSYFHRHFTNKRKIVITNQKKHTTAHRSRLRDRFLDEPHKLPDYELLELILGYVQIRKDTKPMAKDLLAKFGNLAGVLDAHPTELQSIDGIGSSTFIFFQVLRQTFARYLEDSVRAKASVSLDDIGQMARSRLAGNPHEEVWAALLDNGNRLLTFICVNRGGSDHVLISPREAIEITIKHKASGLVLVHNHPGGSLTPTIPDLEATRQLRQAMHMVRLRFIDHLIIADGQYYSLTKDHLL